jgi:hypothetical protein
VEPATRPTTDEECGSGPAGPDIFDPHTISFSIDRHRNNNTAKNLTIGVDRSVCRERARRRGKYYSLINRLVPILAPSPASFIDQPTSEGGKRSLPFKDKYHVRVQISKI